MVYSHCLRAGTGTGTGTGTCIRNNGLYSFKKSFSHCTRTGTGTCIGAGKNGLCTNYSGPETVSGGVF